MVAALKELSKPMWILLLVTFFNWMAWFSFLLFDTDWMGKDIYGGKLRAHMYNRGVRVGALGLMLNSVLSGLASLCIERLTRWVGDVKRLSGGMNFLLAVCLAMTLVVPHMARSEPEFAKATPETGVVGLALATFAVLGAPLAVTFSVPCALTSIFCNNSRVGQGLSLSVLNLAVVIPQVQTTLFQNTIYKIFISWVLNFNSLSFTDCGLLVERAMGLANGRWQHACIRGGSRVAAVSGIIAFTMLSTPPPDVLATVSGGGGMH
ncbi:putative MFS transporter superfamily [Helianthus anomalus]